MTIDILVDEISIFVLVFCRVAGMILFNPLLARNNVPSQVRTGLVLGTTILISQPFSINDLPTLTNLMFIIIMVRELTLGFICGYIFQYFHYMLFAAGDIIDMGFGLAMAKAFDPGSNIQASVTGNVFQLMFIMYIFATDSHLTFIQLIAVSYEFIDLGAVSVNLDIISFMMTLFTIVFKLAIQLVLPFLAASFTLEMAMGMLMKLIPQINVFVINFQFKVLFGVTLLFLFGNATAEYLLGYIDEMLRTMVEVFKIM